MGMQLQTSWKQDILASLVVFLVALPLSMGIAVASGVPLEKAAPVGLLTAVMGGVVVGLLGGCQLQVTGPAAGLSVMVALFVEDLGLSGLQAATILAGAIQIIAGLVRIGQIFRAVAPALIEGMLGGIGVLIFVSQFHVMIDDTPPGTGKEFGGIINIVTIPDAIIKAFTIPEHIAPASIGVMTILIILLWVQYAPRIMNILPAPLVGVVIATVAVSTLNLSIQKVPVPDQLLDAVTLFSVDTISRLLDRQIWIAALSLAFVASAESLLTASAVDSMQSRAPRTNYNRELFGQGVGNLVNGLLGLLPMTGVIVRSSANVLAGAQTRLSSVLHGLWIFVFIVLFPEVLRLIPVSSLAAVLVYTGVRLMKFRVFVELWRTDKAETIVFATTLATVVTVDLLTGIIVGLIAAVLKLLYTLTHLKTTVEHHDDGTITVYLEGAATFLRLPQLAALFESLPLHAKVHVHFEHLTYIDHACLDLLVKWERQSQAHGGELTIDWESLHGVFQKNAWTTTSGK